VLRTARGPPSDADPLTSGTSRIRLATRPRGPWCPGWRCGLGP